MDGRNPSTVYRLSEFLEIDNFWRGLDPIQLPYSRENWEWSRYQIISRCRLLKKE
jgi:hypothetical protein